MQKFILIRFFQAIITSLLLVTVVFMLVRISGDPLTWMVDPRTPIEVQEEVARMYGLDKPLIAQYGYYLYNMVQGDFGKSFFYKRSAMGVILERVPATLELTVTAMLLAIFIAIPIGVYSAVRRGKFLDGIVRLWAFLGISTPPFWLGLMLIYIFAVTLDILPVAGRGGIDNLIMPACVLAWALAAGMARLSRSGMLEVLNTDYITMARAKGVPEWKIIWKHAFKNAAIPVVTMTSLLMIMVLSGCIVLEAIFAWPGVGRLILDSVVRRDYTVVQAFVIFISFSFIMISMLADIAYAYLNPKIRYQ
jgi:peptide/nickel transport system permease protein